MTAVMDEETRAFLSAPHLAVLATVSPRGRPHATPIWYTLDGDRVIVNMHVGRVKLRNLNANPYLALTVVDSKDIYRYVQIRGKVERFDAGVGARDIDRLSVRYTGRPYAYHGGQRPEDRVTVVIEPLRISGLRRG